MSVLWKVGKKFFSRKLYWCKENPRHKNQKKMQESLFQFNFHLRKFLQKNVLFLSDFYPILGHITYSNSITRLGRWMKFSMMLTNTDLYPYKRFDKDWLFLFLLCAETWTDPTFWDLTIYLMPFDFHID